MLRRSATGRRDVARVILPLGLHQIFAWGTSYYLLTVLAGPIARDTGWPLTFVTAGISVGLVSSGLVSPFVGRSIQRFDGARVLAAGSLLLAAGLAGMALAPSLLLYLIAWAVLGAGMGGALYDAAFSTLGTLYGVRARGAITTLTLFGGFASTVCWPLSAGLVENFGWREACAIYAGLHLLVSAPLMFFVLPRRALDRAADVPQPEQGPATPAHPALMPLLTAIFVAGSAIFAIVSIHLLTLLRGLGLALAASVALGALIGPSQVGARVVEMAFGVRYHPIFTLVTASALICAGIALLWSDFVVVAVCLVLYGAGNGIWSISRGTVPLALFGAKDFPRHMGRLARAAFLSQAIAPFLGALAIERFDAGASLAALAMLAALNLALVLTLIGVMTKNEARLCDNRS